MRERDGRRDGSTHAPGAGGRHDAPGIGVGKRTLVSTTFAPVQLHGAGRPPAQPDLTPGGDAQVHAAAARGVAGPACALPHAETIQRLFGRHDVSGIHAHVGGPAAEATQAMGAEAFATGDSLIGGAIGFFAGEKAVSGAFDLFDEKIDEAASRDYEHFKELNPDATPADYNRMQQQMDNFDTWGIP